MDKFFSFEDDFESIIKNTLKDENIIESKINPTGWTNIVYEVKTDNGSYFFRFPRDEFWSRTIVKDYEFSKFIKGKTHFETAELELYYDNDRPYSVHKKIEGVPLAEVMNDLKDNVVDDVSKGIAQFMFDLHNLKQSKIFSINDISLSLDGFLDELLRKHVDDEDMKFWVNKKRKGDAIVHGDLNSSNVILENNKVKAFIDFGFAGYGNKYQDISRIIGRCPKVFKDKIVKHYEEISKTKLSDELVEENIEIWSNIDHSYINYMKKAGIMNI